MARCCNRVVAYLLFCVATTVTKLVDIVINTLIKIPSSSDCFVAAESVHTTHCFRQIFKARSRLKKTSAYTTADCAIIRVER